MGKVSTLTCPSCGGKQQANPITSVLVCAYCGREHLVNRIGDELRLESFARCPRCPRNDKVDKVPTCRWY